VDHYLTVNTMTEKRTSSFHEYHADDAGVPDTTGAAPENSQGDEGPVAPRSRDVLTPAEWKKVCWFFDVNVESILEEFEQRSQCEWWLSWLNRSDALPDAVRDKLRAHLQILLSEDGLRPLQADHPSVAIGSSEAGTHVPDPTEIALATADAVMQQPISAPTGAAQSFSEPKQKIAEEKNPSEPACLCVFRLDEDWWDGSGGVPNPFARSALFSATRVSSRRLLNQRVASLSNYTIRVTGPQLIQADLEVWMRAVELARHGEPVQINRRAFLERLDRSTGSSDREWLARSLKRLSECHIDVSVNGKPRFAGRLLKSLRIQKRSQQASDLNAREIELDVDPSMATLFRDGTTQIRFSAWTKLRGDPLASWLLGFYLSHEKPFDIKVETLQRLCGANGSLSVFRHRLEDSLLALESGRHLGPASIMQDKVSVTRKVKPIDGQNRFEDQNESQSRRRRGGRSPGRTAKRKSRSQHPVEPTSWQRVVSVCRRVGLICSALWRPCRPHGGNVKGADFGNSAPRDASRAPVQ
jgi:hypothetical protein